MTIDEKYIKEMVKDLLGASDVARELGWDIRKVSVYRERGVLPAPIAEIGGRPVWWRKDIEEYRKKIEKGC